MPEKNLITTDYAYLIDSTGDYVTASDATHTPLITPNASLTSQARHVLARSAGATIVARSSGQDVFTRGGTHPLITPKAPLVSR